MQYKHLYRVWGDYRGWHGQFYGTKKMFTKFELNPMVNSVPQHRKGESPTQKEQLPFALACAPEKINTIDLMSLKWKQHYFYPVKNNSSY